MDYLQMTIFFLSSLDHFSSNEWRNVQKNRNDSNQRWDHTRTMPRKIEASEWSVKTIETIDFNAPSRAANNRNVIYHLHTFHSIHLLFEVLFRAFIACTIRSKWHSMRSFIINNRFMTEEIYPFDCHGNRLHYNICDFHSANKSISFALCNSITCSASL